MSFPATADIWMMVLIALNLVAIVACIVWIRLRSSRQKRKIALINATILEYVGRSGVKVKVNSVSLGSKDHYTAFIESEPMKQFRLSHIIELTLREHVAKTCKLKLDKIYWRFPIKEAAQQDATKAVKPAQHDDYINEGLVRYKDLPKADVSEIPWEQFQELSLTTTDSPVTAETTQQEGKRAG